MNKEKNSIKGFLIGFFVVLFILMIAFSSDSDKTNTSQGNNTFFKSSSKTFRVISSTENKDVEYLLNNFAKENGYDIQIEYDGTLDIMQRINNGEEFDGVWVSNAIWLYMLDKSASTSKSISINPVVFGITKSKAQELGFIDNDQIKMQDIVDNIKSGNLKFTMSNPVRTNSGASGYLGMLQVLAGNPEVLKSEDLENPELKDNLKALFSGMERSSGSDEFLEESFLNGDYEAVVTYEASIIDLNKELIAKGKEPLYAIYPIDGISLSDSPFAYLDHKDDSKKEIYDNLTNYLLSNEVQIELQKEGRRTWFGGVNPNADQTIFNPEWGIDTNKYITPIKYPSTAVIKQALNLYQSELRKPVHVVFCLDYSGSMAGLGYNQLTNAMQYILTDKAAENFIQFSSEDKIDVIPFASDVSDAWYTEDGTQTADLIREINDRKPSGGTALYPAAQKALQLLESEDRNTYNTSIILMTDGMANRGSFSELKWTYDSIGLDIPIYSIMFGSADESELNSIAELTNAKVFDGKTDLVKAFKEVRGYN